SQPTRVTFLAAAALLAAPVQARLIAQSRPKADSTALVALEGRWLAAEHDSFEALTVRLYGDIGIATGIVRATDANGKVDRTAFTDVFARRDAQWQAV